MNHWCPSNHVILIVLIVKTNWMQKKLEKKERVFEMESKVQKRAHLCVIDSKEFKRVSTEPRSHTAAFAHYSRA